MSGVSACWTPVIVLSTICGLITDLQCILVYSTENPIFRYPSTVLNYRLSGKTPWQYDGKASCMSKQSVTLLHWFWRPAKTMNVLIIRFKTLWLEYITIRIVRITRGFGKHLPLMLRSAELNTFSMTNTIWICVYWIEFVIEFVFIHRFSDIL